MPPSPVQIVNYVATALSQLTSQFSKARPAGAPVSTGTGLLHNTSGGQDPAAYLGAAAQFPVVNAGATDTAWVSMSGDVTMAAAGATTVGKLTGIASLVSIIASTLSWAAGAGAPLLSQDQLAGTGASAGQRMTIQAQQGQQQTGGSANNNGADLWLSSGGPGTGGGGAAAVAGNLELQTGGTAQLRLTPSAIVDVNSNPIQFGTGSMPTTGLVRFGAVNATTLIAALSGATTQSLFSWDAATGSLVVGGSTSFTNEVSSTSIACITGGNIFLTLGSATAAGFTISAGVNKWTFWDPNSSPLLQQTAASGAALNMSIVAQAAGGTNDGGQLILTGGAHAGAGTVDGSIKLTTALNAGYFTLASGATQTLTNAQSNANCFLFTGTATAPTYTLARRIADTSLIFVRNSMTNTVIISFLTGGTVSLATNTSALIQSDGTNLQKIIIGT